MVVQNKLTGSLFKFLAQQRLELSQNTGNARNAPILIKRSCNLKIHTWGIIKAQA